MLIFVRRHGIGGCDDEDQIFLLLSAIACAIGAWAFGRYLDTDAVAALMMLALVSVVADNLRLRRKLREAERRG